MILEVFSDLHDYMNTYTFTKAQDSSSGYSCSFQNPFGRIMQLMKNLSWIFRKKTPNNTTNSHNIYTVQQSLYFQFVELKSSFFKLLDFLLNWWGAGYMLAWIILSASVLYSKTGFILAKMADLQQNHRVFGLELLSSLDFT